MSLDILNFAKGIAYAIVWLAAAATLVRGVIGPLVGSASDYGLAGAVLAGAGGIVALAWLASIMLADITKGAKPQKKETEEND